MNFTNIKSLIYSSKDLSTIDIVATCEALGEITMTLHLIKPEGIHHFATAVFDLETKEKILIPLEEYCKTLDIAPFVGPSLDEQKNKKIQDLQKTLNYEAPTTCLDIAWVGGYDSAQMLSAKRTLCLEMGLASCTFTDSVDADHVLTLIGAKEVCIKVAQEFEERRAAYKAKKRAIEACTTIEELEAILL